MLLLRFVILCLAAYRITQFVVTDSVPEDDGTGGFPPGVAARRWLVQRTGADSAWVALISCPFCFGFWVSLVVVAIGWRDGALIDRGLLVWAVAAVVGLLSRVTSE